jgi:polyhydroxybutyrate depolymerase
VVGETADFAFDLEAAAAVALQSAVTELPLVAPLPPSGSAAPTTSPAAVTAPTTSPGAVTVPAQVPAPPLLGDRIADFLAIPLPAPLAIGATEAQLSVGGFTRNYVAVVPPLSTKPRSLLIVLHGVNGRGANMRAMGFEPSAAANGTVVVYPDAIGGSWNDGRVGMEPMQSGMVTDDVAFVKALINDVTVRANVDPSRVAVAGFSNGAMMASRLACELADQLRGAALVAGTGGQNYPQVCHPTRTVPIMEVHGTSDPIVPYAGGKVADNQGRKRGMALSVADFVSFWSNTSHCAGARETAIKAALAVTKVEAQACTSGSPLVHYRVTGGVHDWFRIQGFDTTKAVWDFLAANSLA